MSAASDGVRRLTAQMRPALVVSVAILLGLGLDLFVVPERTDRFLSWPAAPA